MTCGKQRDVAAMFDRIAKTYDLLNHGFSLGIDRRWRRLAIRRLRITNGMRVLDCGAGTGDLSLSAHDSCAEVRTVLLDPAQAMLEIADRKAGLIPEARFQLVRGAAEDLPFPHGTFDRFMVAFGIRNFADLERGMHELHRVLKPGGLGVILEFTPERARLLDRAFRWYMLRIMAPLGNLIARDPDAYSYLSRTIEQFQTASELRRLFEAVGFDCAADVPLSFGIARLFVLKKTAIL